MARKIELTKGFLIEAIPGLREALASPKAFLAASLIRRYISSIASFSDPLMILDHEKYGKGEWLLKGLLEYRGGVWCGGLSALFTEALKAAGIAACQYYYGWGDGLSHATTLFASVPLGGGTAQQDFYLLDSYLGYHYETPTGKMMKFADVLECVSRQDYARVAVHHTDLPRLYLTLPDEDITDSAWLFPERRIPAPIRHGSVWAYPGAVLNWKKLFASTSPSRQIADRRRGDKPLEHFVLDMLFINPRLGGIENRFEPCHRNFRRMKQLMEQYGKEDASV